MIKLLGRTYLVEPERVFAHANTDLEAISDCAETWEESVIVMTKVVDEWDARIKACLKSSPLDEVRLRDFVKNRDNAKELLFRFQNRF